MSMLAAQDFQGLYAIIPTPSKPGADRADAVDTIDIAETARVVEQLLGDKIDGLIVLGTTGECATITRDEYETFVDCVLGTVRGRVPPSSVRRSSARTRSFTGRALPATTARTGSCSACRCGSR